MNGHLHIIDICTNTQCKSRVVLNVVILQILFLPYVHRHSNSLQTFIYAVSLHSIADEPLVTEPNFYIVLSVSLKYIHILHLYISLVVLHFEN